LSEPEFVLKHRIVGAVILIGFGVVVLPWVLGGGSGTKLAPESVPAATADNNGADSNTNTKVFVSRITPIGGATPPVLTVAKPEPTETAAQTPPAAATPASKAAPPQASPTVGSQPKSTSVPAPESKPKTPAKSAKAEPALTRGWVVRIGTFSKIDNAKRVMETLSKKGFRPKTGKINTKNGVATRVWVGPYAKRVEAARVRTRIERVTGEKGLITPYP